MSDDTILALEEASKLSSLHIQENAKRLRKRIRAIDARNKKHHEEVVYSF